ncbi:uncharacterized protein LOC116853602 [Odontomachus brunneus]|uniref:uncharacterized protein LOC116853602 n=1 Tax=Odontomachus brunneus TaxID=486640 RepID=UPI0013F19021|nr:uncharacterized protein LOC116853602 [Odontomachus brunneus]
MLNVAFGESSMNKTSIYKWYKCFQKSREDVKDDERPGRSSTSTTDDNVEKVKKMIMNNRRITIREVADDIGIPFGSCQAIFSDLWRNNSWQLHHDNAPTHTSLLVREFLARNNTVMMPQSPYSPNMGPCDFFLFPKLKRTMKGQCFANIKEIKTESLKELNAKPKIAFQKYFENWKKRWHKCIISNGEYFERDKINIDE